ARIDRPLELLSPLRRAIQDSWSLLLDDEKAALVELTVFRGGFSVGAAEAVIDAPNGRSALDVPQSLREKSLVTTATSSDDRARFGLLIAVREFATEQDASRTLAGGASARHAQYFCSRLRAQRDAAEIAKERDNLLVVVERAFAGDIDVAFGI